LAPDINPSDREAFVLDSTAFYAGITSTGISVYYTTPSVIREVFNNKALSMAIPALIESKRMMVIEPLNHIIKEVRLMASKSGDIHKLSNTDISIVALGIQLRQEGYDAIIISDDYSVQNLVRFFGLKFSPVMIRGITKTIRWLIYCSGCGKVFYDGSSTTCDICGTVLKRKRRK